MTVQLNGPPPRIVLRRSSGAQITIATVIKTMVSGVSNPMTEDLDAASHSIANLQDPVNDQDVATKKYVDDNAGSGGNSYNPGGW